MTKPKSVIVIGAGIGGIATAILLAKQGVAVTIYDNHDKPGGRAGLLEYGGFKFDTGPSWFLMPEVFRHYFELIGEDMDALLALQRLNPAYKVFFESGVEPITIYGDEAKDTATFEQIEPGAGKALTRYLDRAERTYKIATQSFLYTNFTPSAFLNSTVLKHGPRMGVFALRSVSKYIAGFVRSPELQQILAYPMVFLGTSPYQAPALYHLMSFMDFRQGVFYPQGGMYKIIEVLHGLAVKHSVQFVMNSEVTEITYSGNMATGIVLKDGSTDEADVVIANGDLHHTETALLSEEAQTYPESYWQRRSPSPGAILLYLGIEGSLPELEHHNLIFTKDWRKNFSDIFEKQAMPSPASMYVCKPSATDPTVAPKGYENVFILVPVPAHKSMKPEIAAQYADQYLQQLADMAGITNLQQRIVYKKVVSPADFNRDLFAWHGSALGLSHTLNQSAWWRPRNKSKKLDNLYYVGGNTIPGIGLPMCLIGAELVYKHLAGDTSNAPLISLPPLEQA